MAYVDPYDRVRKRPTIYDGKGHVTTPYSTIYGKGTKTPPYHINRRWIRFHARFYTQNGGYDANYTIGRYDTRTKTDSTLPSNQLTTPKLEHEFSNELEGFKTNNQGNNSLPTMNIYLFAFRDWEQILQVNDYCALTVEECYPDDLNWIKEAKNDHFAHGAIEQRTLMTGLIANIHKSEDSQVQGRSYVITCNGMEKILSDITLGLPPKAQIGGVNLLFDINGESNPANETFPFGSGNNASSGSSSSSNDSGPSKEIGNQVEQGIIAWCNHMKYSVNQTAGVLAAAEGESSMGAANNGFNLLGYSPGSNTTGTSLLGNVAHTKSNAYKYCQEFYDKTNGGFKQYKSATSSYSAYKCGAWFCAKVDIPGGQNSMDSGPAQQRGTWAEKYASQLK